MTEIPEHLLKRSRERREAIGGAPESGASPSAPGQAVASSAPAAAVPAAPKVAPPAVPVGPPPVKPDPPYVQAEKRRGKIPIWALPVLGLLPLWVFMYANSLQPKEVTLVGPLAAGDEVYASKCSSCHGAGGEGGVGYQLSSGEVLKTFPKLEDQITFIYTGNTPYIGKGYGDPNRPGGQHVGGKLGAAGAMPAWGQTAGGELTDLELLEVVCHERITLAGSDPTAEENLSWCTADGENYLKVASGGLEAAGVAKGP